MRGELALSYSTTETNDSDVTVANNMALLYADKLRKKLCRWKDVPETLVEAVEALLAGGE